MKDTIHLLKYCSFVMLSIEILWLLLLIKKHSKSMSVDEFLQNATLQEYVKAGAHARMIVLLFFFSLAMILFPLR